MLAFAFSIFFRRFFISSGIERMGTRVRRLALSRVEILSITEQGRLKTQVKVVLSFGENQFVGRSVVEPDDEDMISSVAKATVEALKNLLPSDVSLTLKKATRMQPQFLNDTLLLVMILCEYDDCVVDLTGACIANEDRVLYGAAGAVLDATNRIMTFLMDFTKLEGNRIDE